MGYLLTVLVFIIVFSVLILIHELGHFVMAKRSGIKVEEFGMGLPPRIWGKKIGETIYSINWIPFGGFVRMLGEDSSDPKALKQKRSFAAQPARVRIKVIVAGVVMNFFLAWILLTFALSVGMQPLLTPDDVLPAVSEGEIVLESGIVIKTVEDGSLAKELGVLENDILYSIDGTVLALNTFDSLREGDVEILGIIRNGEKIDLKFSQPKNIDFVTEMGLGFYDYIPFPRVMVYAVEKLNIYYNAGLEPGDAILNVNGKDVFDIYMFEDSLRGQEKLDLLIYRGGVVKPLTVFLGEFKKIIVSDVVKDSPAMEVGIMHGDVILTVNGDEVGEVTDFIKTVSDLKDGESIKFTVYRGGVVLDFEILPTDGKIGVMLSELMHFGNRRGIMVYTDDVISSVLEIKDQKYPVYLAAIEAFKEGYRLSVLTVKMFGNFVLSFAQSGQVPDTVAGPVGIAQMTHVFVQEGFISVLRFVAMLSLSLGVLNILPIPALDGGRLFFILAEILMGKRINQKWETVIHAMGYLFIMIMIVAVTYSDIVRLFVK